MIRNPDKLREWEKQQLRHAPRDFIQNLRLFEAMYEEARVFGILPFDNPLEGIQAKIDFARKINVPTPAGENRTGS
jgi:hypothetical protein